MIRDSRQQKRTRSRDRGNGGLCPLNNFQNVLKQAPRSVEKSRGLKKWDGGGLKPNKSGLTGDSSVDFCIFGKMQAPPPPFSAMPVKNIQIIVSLLSMISPPKKRFGPSAICSVVPDAKESLLLALQGSEGMKTPFSSQCPRHWIDIHRLSYFYNHATQKASLQCATS